MKSTRILSLLVLSTILLTGCYTQIQFTEKKTEPVSEYRLPPLEDTTSATATGTDTAYAMGFYDGYQEGIIPYRDYQTYWWWRNMTGYSYMHDPYFVRDFYFGTRYGYYGGYYGYPEWRFAVTVGSYYPYYRHHWYYPGYWYGGYWNNYTYWGGYTGGGSSSTDRIRYSGVDRSVRSEHGDLVRNRRVRERSTSNEQYKAGANLERMMRALRSNSSGRSYYTPPRTRSGSSSINSGNRSRSSSRGVFSNGSSNNSSKVRSSGSSNNTRVRSSGSSSSSRSRSSGSSSSRTRDSGSQSDRSRD